MSKVSVSSLKNPEFTGWLTKQGANMKTWKRRYFVLTDKDIYYFKTTTATDMTGIINLTKDSVIKKETAPGKPFLMSVGTTNRTFLIKAADDAELNSWIKHINAVLEKLKGPPMPKLETKKSFNITNSVTLSSQSQSQTQTQNQNQPKKITGLPLLNSIQKEIGFLVEGSNPFQFWKKWLESIPTESELKSNLSFEIATSGDLQKVSWRYSGTQYILIQKMVVCTVSLTILKIRLG